MQKWVNNKKGFTLTEVMIGILILTVAIVSASNLLSSLIRTNQINVSTLQAYYLAQEGVEAVRNIRDANWLHNGDYLIDGGVYENLEKGDSYAITLLQRGWAVSNMDEDVISAVALGNSYSAWDVVNLGPIGTIDRDDSRSELGLFEDGDRHFVTDTDSDFQFFRQIEIMDYCLESDREDISDEDCEDFVLVKSIVYFDVGGDEREVVLETVLTNWKDGAL